MVKIRRRQLVWGNTRTFFEDLNEDLDLETLRQLGYAPVEPGKVGDVDEEVDEELERELQQELEEESVTDPEEDA